MKHKTDQQVGSEYIDAYAFARQEKQAQGTVPLQRLLRFVTGLPEQPVGEAGLVTWSVRGETGKPGLRMGQWFLHLQVQANPVVTCQRCNMPFVYPIHSRVQLQLVKSEADLDEEFPESEWDEGGDDQDEDSEAGKVSAAYQAEKVLGSHRFDLLAQIEDELILSIPYVPKHAICPGISVNKGVSSQEDVPERPSPFAVLEQLKQKD